jgi:hypothetical protein
MRRDQLEHAIRTTCQIIGRPEVIVVGSQAILGTFREDQLPAEATMSIEVGDTSDRGPVNSHHSTNSTASASTESI